MGPHSSVFFGIGGGGTGGGNFGDTLSPPLLGVVSAYGRLKIKSKYVAGIMTVENYFLCLLWNNKVTLSGVLTIDIDIVYFPGQHT